MSFAFVLTEQWFSVFIGAVVLFLLYCWGTSKRRMLEAQFPGVPGPKPLPFVDNLFDAIRHKGQFYLQFDEYYKKYGKVFALISFTGKPTLAVNEPELIKQIMVKNFSSFHDRPVSNIFTKCFYYLICPLFMRACCSGTGKILITVFIYNFGSHYRLTA